MADADAAMIVMTVLMGGLLFAGMTDMKIAILIVCSMGARGATIMMTK